MREVCSIALLVALATTISWTAVADDNGVTPVYFSVECMKSTSADYEQLETDIWKPMHQYLVDQGQRTAWALYRVAYGDRSRCDYYTVTTHTGDGQLHAAPDYAAAFAAAHPNADAAKAMEKTFAAREIVSAELWMQIDRTDMRPHRYAIFNKMFADDPVAYESMESEVFKAGHEALIADGHRSGWSVYSLVAPTGSAIPYNYGTIDFVNELGPVPMAEAMLRGNPDRDLDELYELLELREDVLSETWELVTSTE
ncbi:MAG: hypothetical protein QNJ11_06200 [Woeseiaceae bacterium]|nr:hypothetical protein [Woeseiaceae bacterium]